MNPVLRLPRVPAAKARVLPPRILRTKRCALRIAAFLFISVLLAAPIPTWLPGTPAVAAAVGWGELPGPGRRVEVELRDGTTVVGTITSLSEIVIVLETERFGTLELALDEVESLRELPPGTPSGTRPPHAEDAASRPPATGVPPTALRGEVTRSYAAEERDANGWYPDPDYNALLLVPTSETFPRGDSYYRNFELLFNNAGFALSDAVNLSVMAAFPVTTDFTIVGLGAKARLLSREEGGIGLALAGSATFTDSEDLEVLSAIATLGNRRQCLSAVFNVALADGESATFVLAGGDVQFSPRAKFVVEYGNSTEGFLDDEFYGILNFGVRFFWPTTSFTITGLRPLTGTGDDFVAFPLASFSAHF